MAGKMLAFFAARLTGQITLNVNQGRIESYDIREHGRVPTMDGKDAPVVYATVGMEKR